VGIWVVGLEKLWEIRGWDLGIEVRGGWREEGSRDKILDMRIVNGVM